MADHHVDILIVGGGLIGALLLHALKATGFSCMLVDKHAGPIRVAEDFDARSLALSAASVRMLTMLDLWSSIAPLASSLSRIHVSEQGRFGSVYLQHPLPDQPLGYVIEMQAMHAVLQKVLDPNTMLTPAQLISFDREQRTATVMIDTQLKTIQARLCVAADGSESMMREWCQLPCQTKTYDHHALVTNIGLVRPHNAVAYERFTRTGPLAMLPLGPKRMALVWSLPPDEAQRLSRVSEGEFLQTLSGVMGYRLGRFEKVGRRVVFPLQQKVMSKQMVDGVVFIGNAAHTLHPVAGQGFNLGLRDVAMLVQMISQYGLDNLSQLFEHYQRARQPDQNTTAHFTDLLARFFTHPHPGVAFVRQIGLIALDNSPSLKRLLSRYASGLGGVVPDLVCGIPLQASL